MKRRGFSLIELSIVLVILGLLVGGILAGQSLIRAAEVRSVGAEYERYTTAVHAFRDKYFALPGDMRNATSFWGFANGSTGTDTACYDTDSTGLTTTCNGNGNGRLWNSDNVADGSAPEWYRAWQHLTNAGLVEGSFSGKAVAGTTRASRSGINIPRSRIPSVGYTLLSYNAPTTGGSWYAGNYDGFSVGATSNTNLYEAGNAFLKPEEAWNLDTKLDDGAPGMGKIRARVIGTCITPNDGSLQATATYTLSNSTIQCSLLMALGNPGGV